MKKHVIFLVLISFIFISMECIGQNVHLVNAGNPHSIAVKQALSKSNIPFDIVDAIDSENNDLYVIFDINLVDESLLPRYFIAYQTDDLVAKNINKTFIQKLSRAIAVWDFSRNNINKYKKDLGHYLYLPQDYEFSDPVILPCLLKSNCLDAYKEMLIYSNNNNSDISSHLPAIFVHTMLQNPEMVVEAGVRGGESTIAFKKALSFTKARLIGIDIDGRTNNVYSPLENAQFLCMNDLHFPALYNKNHELNKYAVDIVFIDTSHYYDHTMREIAQFSKILSDRGFLLFHDSYMSPLANHQWYCLNGTVFGHGWDNQKGVTRAIKDSFSISFDETKYNNFQFEKNGQIWQFLHYPFCNGLTLIKKIKKEGR